MKPLRHLSSAAKWALFRTLERATGGGGTTPAPLAASPTPALCVFASTIGELNAVAPFLFAARARMPPRPLWLLSDHAHYRESFLRRCPDAHFFAVDHYSETAAAFFARVPVRLFALAEMPLVPHDAPARLPFAWLRGAKRAGATLTAINGWLYRTPAACRMDALERALFSRDQIGLFDQITVQSEHTRAALIEMGASAARVHVTGNLKFDMTPQPAGPVVLPGRPLIVAGSMNNVEEYALVLDAFSITRAQLPSCALILAPRHPQNRERLDRLCATLAQRGLHYQLRSTGIAPAGMDCLVLDTLGELADTYAQGDCAHVGINHNVLEPVLHDKPTTVCPGWEPRYPSYPVYRTLLEAGLLRQAGAADALAAHWVEAIAGGATPGTASLAALRGATARTLGLWERAGWLN